MGIYKAIKLIQRFLLDIIIHLFTLSPSGREVIKKPRLREAFCLLIILIFTWHVMQSNNGEKISIRSQSKAFEGLKKTARFPSPLQAWYDIEKLKKIEKRHNEIDYNEILMALKGTKNRWFKLTTSFPDLFDKFYEKVFKEKWNIFISQLLSR